MANTNGPFGLRPVGHGSGGTPHRMNEYSIASAYDTNIFTGDVVEMTGTGTNVAKAAAGNADNIGVFMGCRYVDSAGRQQFSQYWPADTTGTEIVALVCDDPEQEFVAQIDTVAAADVGNLVDWHVGTGSTTTGQSGLYADESTKATTGTALRILGLAPIPGNDYGAYAKIRVRFAEHVLKGVVSGVGGV